MSTSIPTCALEGWAHRLPLRYPAGRQDLLAADDHGGAAVRERIHSDAVGTQLSQVGLSGRARQTVRSSCEPDLDLVATLPVGAHEGQGAVQEHCEPVPAPAVHSHLWCPDFQWRLLIYHRAPTAVGAMPSRGLLYPNNIART